MVSGPGKYSNELIFARTHTNMRLIHDLNNHFFLSSHVYAEIFESLQVRFDIFCELVPLNNQILTDLRGKQ